MAPVNTSGLSPRSHNVLSYAVTALWPLLLRSVGLLPSVTSPLLWILWISHFVRRTAESAFLHVYRKEPVSWSDALSEYAYYWGFASWIFLTQPAVTLSNISTVQLAAVAAFVLAEFLNFECHSILAATPKTGGTKTYPRHALWRMVSHPHYLFEILAWCAFVVVAHFQVAALMYLCVASFVMISWAREKHAKYRVPPPTKFAVIPGVI